MQFLCHWNTVAELGYRPYAQNGRIKGYASNRLQGWGQRGDRTSAPESTQDAENSSAMIAGCFRARYNFRRDHKSTSWGMSASGAKRMFKRKQHLGLMRKSRNGVSPLTDKIFISLFEGR